MHVDYVLREDAEEFLVQHLELFGEGRGGYRRKSIQTFLGELCDETSGTISISQKDLERWMVRFVSGRPVMNARRRLGAVARFVSELQKAKVISVDPIDRFRKRFRQGSWAHLVPALQAEDAGAALRSLHKTSDKPPEIEQLVAEYLKHQRALGKKYIHDERDLRSLIRFLDQEGLSTVESISSPAIESWYDSLNGTWRTRHAKICNVNRFFKHLLLSRNIASNPVPKLLLAVRHGVPRSNPPFIFSVEQIGKVFEQLGQQPANAVTPWRPRMCRTMATLQYGCGLRHGELRRLCIHHVDMKRRTLFIEATKFYKSRCLPFGERLGTFLQGFLDFRATVLLPVKGTHPLFVSRWRRSMCDSVYGDSFHAAMESLGIKTERGTVPRPHDLRHSFAVHRLARWYRENVDVQTRLPWLSTFLGHVDIHSTEVYLTITAELLDQASSRFYSGFGCEITKGKA